MPVPLYGLAAPKVGVSIAVHAPKFFELGRFVRQWGACGAAMRALSVYAVFSGADEAALFRQGLSALQRHPPAGAPLHFVTARGIPARAGGQAIAAYKKWFGLAAMMAADAPPRYGLMLDSELLVHTCVPRHWSALFGRLRALERRASWPAARVDETLKYNFGTHVMSGRQYDQALIRENARFALAGRGLEACGAGRGCAELRRVLNLTLFSWWTDAPYVNLTRGRAMLRALAAQSARGAAERRRLEAIADVRELLVESRLRPSRFEILAYHYWCVLHHNHTFEDVTAVAGHSHWGSYLEHPDVGSRFGELEPLMISSGGVRRCVCRRLQSAAP